MSDEPVVLGVCIERLSMEPCVIVNCFDDIKEFKGHGELIGRGVSSKMPGLKAHHYLGWCTLPPGKVCSGHWHDCEEIWVIISGEAILIDCNGSERKIKKRLSRMSKYWKGTARFHCDRVADPSTGDSL